MIAYYAHSHGSGHLTKAQLFADVFQKELIILTSRNAALSQCKRIYKLDTEDLDGSELPQDRFPNPDFLHYAPIGIRKNAQRMCDTLNALIRHRVDLFIIDVSVEMAAMARVASIPYAYVRLFGDRSDIPHRAAYQGAVVLLAYFPQILEDPSTPIWIRQKTIYFGFFSKYTYGIPKQQVELCSSDRLNICIILGAGGSGLCSGDVEALLAKYSSAEITLLGELPFNVSHHRCHLLGKIGDISTIVNSSDVVIASVGLNLMSELLALDANIYGIIEVRPFDEQICFAQQLVEAGLIRVYDKENINLLPKNIEKKIYRNNMVNSTAIRQFKVYLNSMDYNWTGVQSDLLAENDLNKLYAKRHHHD